MASALSAKTLADPPAAAQEEDLVDALAQVTFVTMAVLSKVGAEHDLSLTQLRVLGILRDRRLKMSNLADFLGLDKSTMTGLVDRAAARGLLERSPNESDRRAFDVFLSPSGLKLAEVVHAQVVRSLSPLTGRLTPGDRRRLQALLGKLLTSP